MMCANIAGNDCVLKSSIKVKSVLKPCSDSCKSSRGSKSTFSKGKRKSVHKQSDLENYLDSSSDDEWKPAFLKQRRKIDPEKVIEINTAQEPLFGKLN